MAKKSKSRGTRHFFFKTRTGFYVLVFAAIIGFTTTINAVNSREYEADSAVLAAKDNRGNSAEAQQQKEERREEHKAEIERRFNVESEGLRVDIKPQQNKVTRELKQDRKEVNIGAANETLMEEIEEEIEDAEDVDIATDGGDVIIGKKKVKAWTGFPLSIDVSTGQLIVTRPDGTQKAVTVLPDQAIQNFMRHKKVEIIGNEPPDDGDGDDDGTGTESAEADFVGTQSIDEESVEDTETETEVEVEIVERNDQLVYEIKGKRKIRILGLIPTETSLTGYVSTETGEVVDETQPLFDRLLNLISLQQ